MVVAKKFVINKYFEGEPKRSDLSLVEEELPALQNGEYLIEAKFLSVDPYMRPYVYRVPLGSTMIGSQVAEIIETKNPYFPVGKHVMANVGWRTHTVVRDDDRGVFEQAPYILPDFDGLPLSVGLGVLGMPGNTAYFGFLEICKPVAKETLVVSGAAGAVGSHVGQIGKIYGLKVIGIAGSDEKCKWLKEELGFDHAINYKTQDVAAALKEAAPNKVDCYFDNVGGEISTIVLGQMKQYGRISVCGCISSYNADPNALPKVTIIQPLILFSQLRMEGFIVMRWLNRWEEGVKHNLTWIKQKKLKYQETVTEGFDNMFDAFIGMLQGKNTGKAIVKV
ncbi:prostaglandin reductase 1-like [Neodiprion virginianus]|uniref:prostaglandin reductase 1-like n=1 Tax=Neodiprion virginianus TaxID=2961670 RepID=UPI001EE69EAF|nr:prostaglandin reductase 1-like [Neodiprion virginianus]